MNSTNPFFEMSVQPDLNDILEGRIDVLEDTSGASWPTVTISSSKRFASMAPEYSRRHRRYDFLIKWLYWQKLELEKESLESFLIDLVPNVHWMMDSWKPMFKYQSTLDIDFDRHTRVFYSRNVSQDYVIPEIIRPYVDFVNSIDITSDILKKHFIGVVNFMIFDENTCDLLVDRPSAGLYCHLIYDSNGKITLVEGEHPKPDCSLRGNYHKLSALFYWGKIGGITKSVRMKSGKMLSGKSRIDGHVNRLFRGDMKPPSILPLYLHYYFSGTTNERSPSRHKLYDNYYSAIPIFKKWFHTLLLVEYACTTLFDKLNGQRAKKCVVSFDKHNKIRIQIHYHDIDIIENYYPESLYESICLFEYIYRNFDHQISQTMTKMRELKQQEI